LILGRPLIGYLNCVGVVMDMLMDLLAGVGDDAGLDNWDILFIFPLLAAEEEDNNLAFSYCIFKLKIARRTTGAKGCYFLAIFFQVFNKSK
jgi:hypothetical protein